MSKILRIACIQLKIVNDKVANISRALEKIKEAKDYGAELICLPEFFNSFYGEKYFEKHAEEIPEGETSTALSKIAKELKVFIISGSIAERHRDDDKLFNTCVVWSQDGNVMKMYRKLHLPDIEGDYFQPGNELSVIEIKDFKIGIGICFDVRFDELAKLYRKVGCNFLVYPVALSLKSGPLHSELLTRSRANDNQCYVALISPARNFDADFVPFGFSNIANPWGQLIAQAKESEEILIADLNLNEVETVRASIPIYSQRRVDIYETVGINSDG